MAQIIKSTTQDHLDIEDVANDLILQKDGSCSLVLQTNAINFGLLSEEEQDATIYAYAAMLNSLTFTVQLLIRSDLKDISAYLRLLREQETKQLDPVKKANISNYKNFVKSFVKERNVLEKKFFLVIPFSTLELGIAKSFTSSFSPKALTAKKTLPFDKNYIIEKATTNLEPKRDHLLRQLGRLGLIARQLKTQELIQLLFSMYNPGSTQGQKISNTKDYTVPLVQPAYIKPKEATMADTATNPLSTPQGTTPSTPNSNPTPPTIPEPTQKPTQEPTPSPSTPTPDTTPSPDTNTPPPSPGPGLAGETTPTPAKPAMASPSGGEDPLSGSTPPPPTPTPDPAPPASPAPDPQSTINSAASDLTSTPPPTKPPTS